jgi:antitoxin (DNA-binding transcriptional repressor) of toxin-antitoxin stability system
MKKARISELKNRLSYYLRFVRRGESVVVYDRDRPIARIEAVRESRTETPDWTDELERAGILRRPTAALPHRWLDARPSAEPDIVAALLEERESGR